MTKTLIEYSPQRATGCGEFLKRTLETRSIKKQDFAMRCGRTPKLISEIISGEAPLVPETAIQFERVLNIDASIWLKMEANFQLHKRKSAEQANWEGQSEWLKKFPISELIKRQIFKKTKKTSDTVGDVLNFFGVASIKACDNLLNQTISEVNYRRDAKFRDDKWAELTWLRMGRVLADSIECAPFDSVKFRKLLPELRSLTHKTMADFLPILQKKCADCGVAVVVVSELKGTHTSGASRWIAKDKAIIQLSNRGKSNDKFWFNFFHESCHVLNHSKKKIFWDATDLKKTNLLDGDVKLEREADEFAADILIPREAYNAYTEHYPQATGRYSLHNIKEYASLIGISPGILLAQLQNDGEKVKYFSNFNKKLKITLEIPD